MKNNYQPWAIKLDDFYKLPTGAEKIKFLLNFAVLAPSSHNSQPWQFEISGNIIQVFLEPSRRLPHSDKNNRQAFISLGCAMENLVIAADYFGFSSEIFYLPQPGRQNLAAQIALIKKASATRPSKNHLIFSIPRRVTNRNQYQDKQPPTDFLKEISSYGDKKTAVFIIQERDIKNKLADVALAASVAAMDDKGFRLELSRYVKPNTTSSPVGMPAFGMGIPTPLSFIAPVMIKFLNMNKLSRKKDGALLKKHTPVFVIIATQQDKPEDWMRVGQIYERIALLATREGLSTAMWAAPIQIGDFYQGFQKILQTKLRPQAFFRLGYAQKPTPHSPRLSADSCLD